MRYKRAIKMKDLEHLADCLLGSRSSLTFSEFVDAIFGVQLYLYYLFTYFIQSVILKFRLDFQIELMNCLSSSGPLAVLPSIEHQASLSIVSRTNR